MSREDFGKQIDLYRRVKHLLPNFVIGFDALQYEDVSNTTLHYIDQLLTLKNTTFYCHGGESLWNGYLADENLLDAILLNAKRISHAYDFTNININFDIFSISFFFFKYEFYFHTGSF